MAKKKHTSKRTTSDATANLIRAANDYICNMQAFFVMAEREVAEHNNTDFDNLEFLLKGARAEFSRLGKLAYVAEEAMEGGAA